MTVFPDLFFLIYICWQIPKKTKKGKKMDENERKSLAREAKSLRYSLSRSDRFYLKALLGYCRVKQMPSDEVLKTKKDACYFVEQILFPKKKRTSGGMIKTADENGTKKQKSNFGEKEEEEKEEEEEEEDIHCCTNKKL